ncbi:MAG: glycosyltransferase [Spirochaetaceae bacterium]|nr:glycosyltransferase [Spirochaetaceae bacterium]
MLLVLITAVLCSTVYTKILFRHNYRKKCRYTKQINQIYINKTLNSLDVPSFDRILFLIILRDSVEDMQIPEAVKPDLQNLLETWKIENRIKRKLYSPFMKERALGLMLLELLSTEKQQKILQKSIKKEKTNILKLIIIQMLCPLKLSDSIDDIVTSLNKSSEVYKLKVIQLLSPFSLQLTDWADNHKYSKNPNHKRIIIQASHSKNRDWFLPFLLGAIEEKDIILRSEAADLLFKEYFSELTMDKILKTSFSDIKRRAVETYIDTNEILNMQKISLYLNTPELRNSIIKAMQKKIQDDSSLIGKIFKIYQKSQDDFERSGWALILSYKISYFIFQLKKTSKESEIVNLIKDTIRNKQSSQLISFINNNKNQVLEKKLFEILTPLVSEDNYFRQQCQLYLDNKIQQRWEIIDDRKHLIIPKIPITRKDKYYMIGLLLLTLSIPILTFIGMNRSLIPYLTGEEIFVSFIYHYHYIFVFYTIAINSIHLLLLILSWQVINKQRSSWNVLNKNFLFTPGILPPVTILAPAYNEEKTIIENIYSLLSLDYPDLEVIVINDGSTDNTAQLIIDHFNLELTDTEIKGTIETAPINGIYKSKEISCLILINKQNGGKADSLNSGINLASGDYICSIDADSILEPESLQKIMARTLINDKETAAIGGNIIPSNGTLVKNGSIKEIHISDNKYARYQTVEYLRSFITGRLGWTKLKNLLIISGAFGIFKKESIIEIGGYMTGKGILHKDTVGEDMEIVVRLIKHLTLKKKDFIVDYAHNANCWTEVPEDLDSLLKQRDRWHRGLIEILIYHKNILFNSRFKGTGLVGFPYFYIFELLGPFLEAIGYIVMIVSLLFGLVSNQIFIFMFSIVVLLGMLVSSMSLFLAEKDIVYFKGRDFLKISLTVIMENFGFRQFLSINRSISFIVYLFKNKGWQKLERKGFNS